MRAALIRAVGLGAALATTMSCGDGGGPPRVNGVSLTPQQVQLGAPMDVALDDLFDVRVDVEGGASRAVRWTTSDTLGSVVDSAGVLHLCVPPPSHRITLTAISVADSTKRASAEGLITVAGSPASISAIYDASTEAPMDINALHGDVFIEVRVAGFACGGLMRVALLAVPTSTGTAVPIGSTSFGQPQLVDFSGRFRWRTTDLSNGQVNLTLRAYLAARPNAAIEVVRPVTLRN
jgi:hypothetical protein